MVIELMLLKKMTMTVYLLPLPLPPQDGGRVMVDLGPSRFFIADNSSWYWPDIYGLLALFMLVLMVTTVFAKEPDIDRDLLRSQATGNPAHSNTGATPSKIALWFKQTLVAPFSEFFSRNGVKLALSFLLFIFLFKIGEAFLGRMSIVFLQRNWFFK